jgi:lipoprotein NlpI
LKPDFEVAYFDRGFAAFLNGNFASAVADYQRTLSINPRADYAILWLHLARGRGGQHDAAELRSNAAKVDLATWPGPLVALYLGQATPAQVMAAAANGDANSQHLMGCIADFYLGEDALSRHETGQAAPLLRESRSTCPHSFLEYRATLFELNRRGE